MTNSRASLWPLWLTLALTLIVLWLLRPMWYPYRADEGHDFLLLYAAAHAVRDLQNPYDPAILAHNAHLAGIPWNLLLNAHSQLSQPYVYPPLFAWLVIPLTFLPPPGALFVWRVVCAAAVLVGTYGLTALWQWSSAIFGTPGRRLIVAAITTVAPLTVYGLYWGNPIPLVYLAMGGWVWALTRGQQWADMAAGALMSVALLKFQLALPLALLATMCLTLGSDAWARRLRVVYGFAAACACWLVLDLLTTGPELLLAWPRSILYLAHFLNAESDMPSLLGLFEVGLNGMPSSLSTKAATLLLVWTILALLALYWRLRRVITPGALLALLGTLWCFGAPYAHANDEILLVPGGLAVLVALDSILERLVHQRQGAGARPRRRARAAVRAGLAVLALGMLYLGGELRFMSFDGNPLPYYVAGLVTLVLLVALWMALPAFACTTEVAADASGRGPRRAQADGDAAGQQSTKHSDRHPEVELAQTTPAQQ